MFNPLKHITDAPCYWLVADDGAKFRCADCQIQYTHNSVRYCLTPNGKTRVLCVNCIDTDWIQNAKQMPDSV